MCEAGGERTLKWRKLVVGDEAPYLVFVAASAENTITTGCQVPIVRKKEVERRETRTGTETRQRERDSDPDRDPATPDGDSKKFFIGRLTLCGYKIFC